MLHRKFYNNVHPAI